MILERSSRVHPMARIQIDLSGPEGNAFALLGYARKLSRQLGLNGDNIHAEMIAADYDNLIQVFEKHFGEYVDLYR